jgi:hypothetical protein
MTSSSKVFDIHHGDLDLAAEVDQRSHNVPSALPRELEKRVQNATIKSSAVAMQLAAADRRMIKLGVNRVTHRCN